MLHHDLGPVFSALADPTRRQMLERLGQGSASVSELAAPLDMTLSAVVQHLQVLEQCGLVLSEKKGRVRTCRLDPQVLAAAEGWLADRRALWDRRFDRLGEILAEPPAKPKESP
jgi:DNA-binding transcriptional ArsR family regulator